MQAVSRQAETEDGEERVASLVERGLFDSALAFYGAAGAVIEQRGRGRPAVRFDVEALTSIGAAMRSLERRIEIAWRAGLTNERIVAITRLEPEIVALIVERQRAEPAR